MPIVSIDRMMFEIHLCLLLPPRDLPLMEPYEVMMLHIRLISSALCLVIENELVIYLMASEIWFYKVVMLIMLLHGKMPLMVL